VIRELTEQEGLKELKELTQFLQDEGFYEAEMSECDR
jgi:hypothetical protein